MKFCFCCFCSTLKRTLFTAAGSVLQESKHLNRSKKVRLLFRDFLLTEPPPGPGPGLHHVSQVQVWFWVHGSPVWTLKPAELEVFFYFVLNEGFGPDQNLCDIISLKMFFINELSVTDEQEGCRIKSRPGTFLGRDCMFCLCSCVFSPDALVSSHRAEPEPDGPL